MLHLLISVTENERLPFLWPSVAFMCTATYRRTIKAGNQKDEFAIARKLIVILLNFCNWTQPQNYFNGEIFQIYSKENENEKEWWVNETTVEIHICCSVF